MFETIPVLKAQTPPSPWPTDATKLPTRSSSRAASSRDRTPLTGTWTSARSTRAAARSTTSPWKRRPSGRTTSTWRASPTTWAFVRTSPSGRTKKPEPKPPGRDSRTTEGCTRSKSACASRSCAASAPACARARPGTSATSATARLEPQLKAHHAATAHRRDGPAQGDGGLLRHVRNGLGGREPELRLEPLVVLVRELAGLGGAHRVRVDEERRDDGGRPDAHADGGGDESALEPLRVAVRGALVRVHAGVEGGVARERIAALLP